MSQAPFIFEEIARPIHGHKSLGVWTDGVTFETDDDPEARRLGFHPAFKLQKGKRYRVTIEPLD